LTGGSSTDGELCCSPNMVDMEHLSDDGADLLMIQTAPPGKTCASLFVTFNGCAPLPPTDRVCVSMTTLSARGGVKVMARTVTCMNHLVEQNQTFACSVVSDALFWSWLCLGQFVFRPLVFNGNVSLISSQMADW